MRIWGTILGFLGLVATASLHCFYKAGIFDAILGVVESGVMAVGINGTDIQSGVGRRLLAANASWVLLDGYSSLSSQTTFTKENWLDAGIVVAVVFGVGAVIVVRVRKQIQVRALWAWARRLSLVGHLSRR